MIIITNLTPPEDHMDITKINLALIVISAILNANASLVKNWEVLQDLEDTCTNCINRSHSPIAIPPFAVNFSPRPIEGLDAEFAVGLAVSYSRYNLADTVRYGRILKRWPMPIEDIPVSQMPFEVDGICLTNMSARVFAFSASPDFSSNVLPCVLVSFFKDSDFSSFGYLYSLYVNDSTGNVGLSIQYCLGRMTFLDKAKRYPFLSPDECEKQQDFVSRLYHRKYGELDLPVFTPPKSPADNSYLLPDIEVDSGEL